MKDIKEKIIHIFKTFYDFHSTLGSRGNISTKFRISSYSKIIKILEHFNKPIYSYHDVENIPNIGKSTLEKINIIQKTGTHPLYEEIIQNKSYKIMLELQKVRGIGPNKAFEMLQEGIKSVKMLKEKVEKGNYVVDKNMNASLKYFDELQRPIPRNEITLFTKLLKKKGLNVINSGSYRMKKKYSGDIDLLCIIKKKSEIKEINKKLENIFLHIYNSSVKKINGIIENPLNKRIYQMDMLFVKEENVPWYLLYFGSGKEFSKKIRYEAIQKGYKLNEKGLYYISTKKRVPFYPKDESEIFDFLKLKYVFPEKR